MFVAADPDMGLVLNPFNTRTNHGELIQVALDRLRSLTAAYGPCPPTSRDRVADAWFDGLLDCHELLDQQVCDRKRTDIVVINGRQALNLSETPHRRYTIGKGLE